jgi:AcrR family transcriptional regulator
MAAARSCIEENGYIQSSVEDIASAAGLTKGALYSQFDSKVDVLLALIDEWADDAVMRISARSRHPDAAVSDFLKSSASRSSASLLALEFWRQAVDDPIVKERLTTAYARIEQALTSALSRWQGVEEGERAANRAVDLHAGLLAMQALGQYRGRLPARDELIDMLFRGEDEVTPIARSASA